MRINRRVMAVVAATSLLSLTACGGGGDSGTGETASADPGATGEVTETSAAPSEEAAPAEPSEGAPVRSDADLVIWTDELKAEAVRGVAETFAEDNGISVDVQVVSQDLQSNFVTANAAGNGPDVFTGAHDWIGNLVQNGAVEPLQISPDDLSGYAEVAVEATTYDGQLYALPYGIESVVLYRNTAIVPEAPATLDDAFAAGQAAVQAGQVESAFNLQQGDVGDAYHMQPLYTSAGGYLFGQDAEGAYDPADLGIGAEGSLAAAQKIYELGEAGSGVLRRSVSGDNSIALFAAGDAAFLVSGPWALNDINAGGIEYDIQPVPGFAGLQPAAPFAGVQGFYVAAGAQNKAFAQEFVTNAMNTEEAMLAMYEGAQLPPALTSVNEQVSGEDPQVAIFTDAAEAGQPMPSIPEMQAVFEPMGKAYAAIIGGADPASTITSAGDTVRSAIGG